MTITTQTPPGALLDPRPDSVPGGFNGGADQPPVPAPRDGERRGGHTPAGTVELFPCSAPVPAGGHRKCGVIGCHGGMLRISFVLFPGEPIRHLLLDDPACDGTGLDLATYSPDGAVDMGLAVPSGHEPGGLS